MTGDFIYHCFYLCCPGESQEILDLLVLSNHLHHHPLLLLEQHCVAKARNDIIIIIIIIIIIMIMIITIIIIIYLLKSIFIKNVKSISLLNLSMYLAQNTCRGNSPD